MEYRGSSKMFGGVQMTDEQKAQIKMEMKLFDHVLFVQEQLHWKFWLARIFGKKIQINVYEYQGKIWICGETAEDFK